MADDDEALPSSVESRLRPYDRLSTRTLLRIALVCLDALTPRVPKSAQEDLERYHRLAKRQVDAQAKRSLAMAPWLRVLSHSESDLRRSRGVARLAALGGAVAWCDVMRDGRAAVGFCGALLDGTTQRLNKLGDDVPAFALRVLQAMDQSE